MILTGIRVLNFGRLLTSQFVTSYSFCSMYVFIFSIYFLKDATPIALIVVQPFDFHIFKCTFN